VRSERIDGKVKQVTLLNLGRHFAVDQSLWPAMCVRIDELLASQASLVEINLPKSAAVETERITVQLQLHKAPAVSAAKTPTQSETKRDAQPESKAVPTTDVQAVDVNSLELVRPRSVGVEHLGLWAMRQVAFVELLRELGLSSPIRAAILGVLIGRMAVPGSELAAHRWLCQQSGLGELLDADFERMPLMTLYRASDALMKYRDIIERTLFNRVHDLLGLNITVTLYDLTNTYFEGTAAANHKANNGRSKETCPELYRRERSDCPLVTLGLVLDGSGPST